MKKFFLLFLLFCTAGYSSEPMCLKEKLNSATAGSYLVLEQNKNFTFFHVFERLENAIVVEEVSISAARFAKNPLSWKEWFEKGAPGHSCWIMSQINLNTGAFEESFSYTHQGWVDVSDSNSFLTTLLNLRFQEVAEQYRRRVGHSSSRGNQRPLWNPRLIVDGQRLNNVPFAAFKARWPSDGTELARKIIEVYLPDHSSPSGNYPDYFPYWLEVEGQIGGAKIRVVDSGLHAHSPKEHFPRRPHRL